MESSPEDLETEIRSQFNRFRGKMAGLFESFGLPERQERAIISTMKSLSYDSENELVDLIRD